ncbi:MAG: SwmB domain-containing protein, partial [Acidobacteria bacterium]|nr:SwmB domain-containing protein [Acidobacteriota bacterium]
MPASQPASQPIASLATGASSRAAAASASRPWRHGPSERLSGADGRRPPRPASPLRPRAPRAPGAWRAAACALATAVALLLGASAAEAQNRDFYAAEVNGSILRVHFNENLRTDSNPAGPAFEVQATPPGGTTRTIRGFGSSVHISGVTVTVSLSPTGGPVLEGETVTVTYTQPATNRLLWVDGAEVPTYVNKPVTNLTDATKPNVIAAELNATELILYFDDRLKASAVPGRFDFWIQRGGSGQGRPFGNPRIDGSNTLRIPAFNPVSPAKHGETFGFAYTPPANAANRIQDESGNELDAIAQWADIDNETPPAPSSAAVNGATLVVTFDGVLEEDPEQVPSASAFRVWRGRSGSNTAVGLIATNPVAVSGTQVTLSLAEAVLSTDSVLLHYQAPTTGGRLHHTDKNRRPVRRYPVKSFLNLGVTNNTPATTAPQFSSAAVNGKWLEVTFNETLQTAISHRPPHSAFEVSAMPLYGTARTIAGASEGNVAISGSTLSVTLASEVERGERVAVKYTKPSTNVLRGTDNNDVGSFDGPATNNTAGSAAPTFSSASYSYRGGGITVHFDGPYLGCAAAAAWRFKVDGGREQSPQVVRCGDRSVLLVLAALTQRPAVEAARAVTVGYNRSVAEAEERSRPIGRQGPSTKLTGTDGSAVESFSDKPVTGLKPRLVPPPTVDGSTLTLTFDEEMDPGATPGNVLFDVTVNGDERYLARSGGVAIAGKTVRLTLSSAVGAGDTVTVRYTKPRGCGGHCSHGLRGASHIAVDTFPDQAVTNNSAGPVFASAKVVGSTLTLTFDKNLDTGSKPSPAAFRVTANNKRLAVASGGVAIAGKTVKLTLFRPASDGDTVKVRYTKPSSNPLRGTNGLAVDTFAEQAVSNNPAIWSATMAAGVTRFNFLGCDDASSSTTENCSERLTKNSFTWKGTNYQVVRVTLVHGSTGGVLTVGLDRAIPSNWTLHVDELPLRITDATLSSGDKEATWRGVNANWSTLPNVSLRLTEGSGGAGVLSGPVEELPDVSVTGVSVVSDPGADQTYGIGDTISVQVTFNQLVVDVDTSGGTPRIKIDLDPAEWGEKWASYSSGSGTANLTFTHTVVEPNISTQGIAVLADTLELNGGTIQSDGADAGLAHTGLAHDANHKVDWQTESDTAGGAGGSDAEPASVTGVSVVSSAGADKTYGDGDTIQVRVTFDEAVDVTGSPRLKIDMDPAEWGEKWASYESGSGTASLTFAHTVVEPNVSTQGIAVLEDTLELNGGTIRAGGADANLAHDGLAHDSNHKVDWQTQSDTGAGGAGGTNGTSEPASVTGVSVVSDAGADETYGDGDTIQVRVAFTEAVDVTGSPRLTIDMDPAEWGEKPAAYQSGSGTSSLTFAYTVAEPNISTQGIAVLANTLELNGGTIRSGGADAKLSHSGLGHDAKHKVDWRPEAVTVTGVSVVSDAGADKTYTLGDAIRIRVTFSEAVPVTGGPVPSMDMDPAEWCARPGPYQGGGATR